ncbi:MAG: hypothetical protein MK008_02005 [Bdellovibrionales bacterium]|nr:hypothetical protein [Bdellovibrionales bacterium]
MSEVTCPKCGMPSTKLYPVETGMRVALESTGQAGNLPDSVCETCYDALSNNISRGVKLRMEEEAKQKNRVMLWKSRVNLVKRGRQLMTQKAFAEAAISYEKYLRVLEMIYEVEKDQLSPDIFSKSSRSKELTVIVSVYWDLVRIYDAHPRYSDNFKKSLGKLTQFAGYSAIYPDIVKKAEIFSRKAKNAGPIRQFIKKSRKSSGRCFIATAVYGSSFHPQVIQLRLFRDYVLNQHALGRKFIAFYYLKSPKWADRLNNTPRVIPFVRFFLNLTSRLIFFLLNRKIRGR